MVGRERLLLGKPGTQWWPSVRGGYKGGTDARQKPCQVGGAGLKRTKEEVKMWVSGLEAQQRSRLKTEQPSQVSHLWKAITRGKTVLLLTTGKTSEDEGCAKCVVIFLWVTSQPWPLTLNGPLGEFPHDLPHHAHPIPSHPVPSP